MSVAPDTDREKQSFAETALRLGGKIGRGSPPHGRDGQGRRAGRDTLRGTPPDRQQPHPPGRLGRQGAARTVHAAAPARDRPVRRRDGAVARRRPQRHDAGTLYDAKGKVSAETLDELARAGYWGMLIDPSTAARARRSRASPASCPDGRRIDAMVAGMASVHGCIGAVDPVQHSARRSRSSASCRAWPAAKRCPASP